MNGLLSEIGKKLPERWISLLVLPGLLFLASVAIARTLGQGHALDLGRLVATIGHIADDYGKRPAAIALAVIGAVLAAAAAGLVARGLALVVERVWFATGPQWLIGWVVRRRQKRWRRADEAYVNCRPRPDEASPLFDARRARLADARNGIGLSPPARPTWIGDRLRSAGVRVRNQYGLDLPFAWPRLWMLITDGERAELRTARSELLTSATLMAWGVLYVVVGATWWPSAAAGVCTILVAWRRGRSTAAGLADLTEATADLHSHELCTALGIETLDGQVTERIGRLVSERLRKGT